MSFQEDKKKLIEYIKCGIGSSNDEHRLEEFFEFIDKLEEKTKEEVQYYSLLSDAYMEVGDTLKAKEFGIKFNLPLLEECRAFDINQINELLYNTPECSSEFDYNENIWAGCCGDFCRYMKQHDEYEEKFYFQCIHCGKEIVWTKVG